MIEHTCVPRSVQFEEAEDKSTNASANATMERKARRVSPFPPGERRFLMKRALAGEQEAR